MPRFDDLVVSWAKDAKIPTEDKVMMLKYSDTGMQDLEVVMEQKEGASADTRREIRSLLYRLASKSGPKQMRDDPTHLMPPMGTGSYVGDLMSHNSAEHGKELTLNAIKQGIRLIDCARYYKNEEVIGDAIKEAIAGGLIARQDVFVCTKVAHPSLEKLEYTEGDFILNPEVNATEKVLEQVRESHKALQLDRIDLVLLHWPGDFNQKDPEVAAKKRHDMWLGLEAAKEEGLVRSIGVSNFTLDHYDSLVAQGITYYPVANQVEVNPFVPGNEFVAGIQQRGMVCMAYCPLASGALLESDQMKSLSDELSLTPAQIVLSWLVQRGIVPVPRTTNPERMAENLTGASTIIEFTQEQLDKIGELEDESKRICPSPANIV